MDKQRLYRPDGILTAVMGKGGLNGGEEDLDKQRCIDRMRF